METLIVICLAIVIFLLLRDKVDFKKNTALKEPKVNVPIGNFDPEIESDDYDLTVPQGVPDEVFGNVPNLEEEEEEWNGYREYSEEVGFATGVTYEELGAVGMLLQQDKL